MTTPRQNTHQTRGGFTCACGKQRKKNDETLSTSFARPHIGTTNSELIFRLIWCALFSVWAGFVVSHPCALMKWVGERDRCRWTTLTYRHIRILFLRFATFRKIESHWSSSLWLLKKKQKQLRNADREDESKKWMVFNCFIINERNGMRFDFAHITCDGSSIISQRVTAATPQSIRATHSHRRKSSGPANLRRWCVILVVLI